MKDELEQIRELLWQLLANANFGSSKVPEFRCAHALKDKNRKAEEAYKIVIELLQSSFQKVSRDE